MNFKSLKNLLLTFSILSVLIFASCGGSEDPGPGDQEPDNKPTSFLNIDPSVTYQTISGFGGADGIFNGINLSDQEAQLAFGTGEGELGMSIFRVKLPYNSSDWPRIAENALEAQQFDGVKILASPWSPPPALKSNNDPVRGILSPENYGAYVEHINDFIQFMSDGGVNLHSISIQNEPDWTPSYESCDWSPAQMTNFLRDHGDDIVGAKVAGPESLNFGQQFTNTILNDEGAATSLDILAGHIYGGGLAPFPLAEEKGKEIWMTEHLYNLGTGNASNPFDAWEALSDEEKWNETMQMLEDIHIAMTYNWNAYIWWYTKRYYSFIGDGTTDDAPTNTILKRGYAFSHFSKFIRPNYVRIGSDFTSVRDLLITAYTRESETVIVIVNNTDSSVPNIGLTISDVAPESAIQYKTSLSQDVSKSELVLENDYLTFTVNSNSVSTIVIN